MYTCRLSHEGRGDISFVAQGTISYSVTSERRERKKKYDIVTKAIKLILPSLECDKTIYRAKMRLYFEISLALC